MIYLYRTLTALLYPLIRLWLILRQRRGKEDPERIGERLGKLRFSRPDGTVIWIHAASVGEANSVMPLLQYLHDSSKTVHLVLTTGTLTSAKVVAGRLPERAYHHFSPVDVPFVVERFLKALKPDAAIWVESEFWPNMLQQTARLQIPYILVNARLSESSFRRWRWLRGSFTRLMQSFTQIFAGSRIDKQRLHQLGVSKVEWLGNLKYDAAILPADPEKTSEAMRRIGDRYVWIASSTHPGEEELVLQAHKHMREVYPDLLTIIAPRHPERSDAISALLSKHRLTVARRSKAQPVLPETDIYLADTLGELGIFYRLCGVVFVGGSLVPHGGHNPIEPAQLDNALLCGPHMNSFSNIVKELKTAQAIIEIQDADSLAEQVLALLRDHDQQEAMAARARQTVEQYRGAATLLAQQMLLALGLQDMQGAASAADKAADQGESGL